MEPLFDHPVFIQSILHIKNQLGETGLAPLEQQVLERIIHSSGDFSLESLLRFSSGACEKGLLALKAGAPILTDTAMAAEAVLPMADRTLKTTVRTIRDWAPDQAPRGSTRLAVGMRKAWEDLTTRLKDQQSPIVLIGSAPSALDVLLDLVEHGAPHPSLIIGMPVGFIGVQHSKSRLAKSGLPYIQLLKSRGGAGIAAATVNALLRAAQ